MFIIIRFFFYKPLKYFFRTCCGSCVEKANELMSVNNPLAHNEYYDSTNNIFFLTIFHANLSYKK